MDASVSRDGSPVEVYRALDGGGDLEVVLECVVPGGTVLDLGSGPGRITNPLARAGCDVVAVDDSQAMLDHIEGATTVLADLWTLDLDRRFDVVLALSHLINDPGRERRVQLLGVGARHVALDGIVLVQRLPLDWTPKDETRTLGAVTLHTHDVELRPNGFRASNTYTVGSRSWTQGYESEWVDDAELDACAASAGLRVDRVLDDNASDDRRRWIVLRLST
jgi:SAM-dependent methyltransferase